MCFRLLVVLCCLLFSVGALFVGCHSSRVVSWFLLCAVCGLLFVRVCCLLLQRVICCLSLVGCCPLFLVCCLL